MITSQQSIMACHVAQPGRPKATLVTWRLVLVKASSLGKSPGSQLFTKKQFNIIIPSRAVMPA
jgi:hypothetical protein